MDTPTRPELEHRAKFQVGDRVYYINASIWFVVARYWSPTRQCIVYDIRSEETGKVKRESERFIFQAVPQHDR